METTKKPALNIALTPVKSSQIHAIGHDAATNTCAICFKNKDGSPGHTYHYENFNAEKFHAFKSAKSHGKYFGANIKNNVKEHPYAKQPQYHFKAA